MAMPKKPKSRKHRNTKRAATSQLEGATVTIDGVRFSPVAPAHSAQGRSVTASWHKPQCSTCGEVIESIDLAMAQWRHDDKTGKNSSPAINCNNGPEPTCSQRFWNSKHTLRPQDIAIAHFRRSPMDAVFVALRGQLDEEAEIKRWAAWVSITVGLPFNAWNSIVALFMNGEVADQLIQRLPIEDTSSTS